MEERVYAIRTVRKRKAEDKDSQIIWQGMVLPEKKLRKLESQVPLIGYGKLQQRPFVCNLLIICRFLTTTPRKYFSIYSSARDAADLLSTTTSTNRQPPILPIPQNL